MGERCNDVYRVTLCLQALWGGPVETFSCQTQASSPDEAEINIRERFRHAYALSINTVKRGV